MASFLAQPHTTLLGGGMPIMVDGGTADQDVEIAQAGLAAIQPRADRTVGQILRIPGDDLTAEGGDAAAAGLEDAPADG